MSDITDTTVDATDPPEERFDPPEYEKPTPRRKIQLTEEDRRRVVASMKSGEYGYGTRRDENLKLLGLDPATVEGWMNQE